MFDILEYIKVKMTELGVKNYTLKPVYFNDTTSTQLVIVPKNEYYVLVGDHAFAALTLFGENEIVNFSSFAEYQAHTGFRHPIMKEKFQITELPNIDVEFIKVIPTDQPIQQ